MPMLVVDDNAFAEEMKMLNGNVKSNVEYRTIEHGRGKGKLETPSDVRKLIASEAIVGVSVEEIAKEYNVSASSISAYKNGATSTKSYHKPEAELANNNKEVRIRISDRAERAALDSLELLTVERIAECKTRDIASIAKDMSSVIRDMSENGNGGISNRVNVMIYQPQVREEADFKTIEVHE